MLTARIQSPMGTGRSAISKAAVLCYMVSNATRLCLKRPGVSEQEGFFGGQFELCATSLRSGLSTWHPSPRSRTSSLKKLFPSSPYTSVNFCP